MFADDINDLVSVLRSWGDLVEVVEQSQSTSQLHTISLVTNEMRNSLIIWNRRFVPRIHPKYIAKANSPYYRIDEQTDSVLQLSPSILTEWQGKLALTQGRIYGTFQGKQSDFEKWYDRIVRHIRKHWRKNPITWLGGYLGPAASEWFDAGGVLLPGYIPPVRSDWIQLLGEQHPV